MSTYASTRREQYRADVDAANAYYRETRDLAGYVVSSSCGWKRWAFPKRR